MTAQITDKAFYQGDEYELIGKRGEQLIKPENFGIEPQAWDTSCWRGYVCCYRIDAQLLLDGLDVRSRDGDYPEIAGVSPTIGGRGASYEELNLPVDFTGKLRLATDFIEEYYVHMGFQKASAYRTVLDMAFSEGRLQSVNDRSEELEDIRGQFKERYGDREIMERIAEAFSLDMDVK